MSRVYLPELMTALGVKARKSIYDRINAGTLPPPTGKDRGRIWWDAQMLDGWLADHDPNQHAAEVRWLPAAMAATIDDAAKALVGLDPEPAWRRMFDMANHAAEMIGRANPHKSVAEVQNLVAIFTRCVRRRALELEEQRRDRVVQ